jgi:hypothetical protein
MGTVANSDNVVSLRDFAQSLSGSAAPARRQPMSSESVGVIADCRDLALKRICEVLRSAFDKIEEELFELAEKTPDRDTQNMYLEARAQAREKRTGIESSFRQHFVSRFDGKVRGEGAKPSQAKEALSFADLALVDDSALEESIALAEMAKKMRAQSEEELFALSQRMGFLMHHDEMGDEANPLSPDTLCTALNEACAEITAGYRIKLTIMKLFEQHVAKDLVAVYRDINSHLVDHHRILPEIKTSYRMPPSQPSKKPAAAPAAEGDMFSTLQQLMNQGPAAGAQMPGAAAGAMSAGAMTGLPAGQMAFVPPAQQALFSKLTEAQHGGLEGVQVPLSIPAGADIAQALNVLHQLSTQGIASGANQVDAMTIDIVAMLFDYVFGDRQIPDAIKALMARLQIPVLKVALLDKQFFSQKSHPARVLLDKLAELALECDDDIDAQDEVYKRIESIVDAVRDGYESDIDVFVQQIALLEAFVAEHDKASTDFVERSARLVHEKEQREIARLVAEAAVRDRIQGKTLPAPVVVMLKARWIDVLRLAYLQGGEDGVNWSAACQTVEELVWSLEPKIGAEDRKSLVSLLPKLLKRLQQGMHAVEVEPSERDRFFASLVDCHAAAVKAGLRQDQATQQTLPDTWVPAETVEVPAPVAAAPAAPADASGFTRIHLESDGVRVEDIRLNQPTPAGAPQASAAPAQNSDMFELPAAAKMTKLPSNLQRGSWVEFKRDDGSKLRVKLSWISPLRGVLLFTNPQSSGAVSVTPDALLAQLKVGSARILDEGPMTERAVHNVLDHLRAA